MLSIEKLLNDFQQSGGKVLLDGVDLMIEDAVSSADASAKAELVRRSAEVIGYLASKRPGIRLPLSGSSIREKLTPLSIAQEQWGYVDRAPLEEQWLPFLWRLEGRLHLPIFVRSYVSLVKRHEILRTRYIPDGDTIVQEVLPESDVKLDAFDLTDEPFESRELQIYDRLEPLFRGAVPLHTGAVKLELFRITDTNHLLGGFIHHVAIDGRGLSILLKELMTGYYHGLASQVLPEAPRLQYGDFVRWERSWLTKQERVLAAAWWEYTLGQAKPVRFPTLRSNKSAPFTPKLVNFSIPDALFAKVKERARECGVTINIIFLTVVALVIASRAKQRQAVLGVVVNGRPAGFEDVIGCFMQMRPFHLQFEDDLDFKELTSRARKMLASASDIRRPVPAELLSRLGVGNVLVNYVLGTRARPPFDAAKGPASPNSSNTGEVRRALSVGKEIDSDLDKPAIAGSKSDENTLKMSVPFMGLSSGFTRLPKKFQSEIYRDIHFGVTQAEDSITARLTYAAERFDRAEISLMLDQFFALLAIAISDPGCRVGKMLADSASGPPVRFRKGPQP